MSRTHILLRKRRGQAGFLRRPAVCHAPIGSEYVTAILDTEIGVFKRVWHRTYRTVEWEEVKE